ncbi:YopJ family acetyltransferase [Rhizobacter sp. Root1221]|uniref:YopJ family acetyltransferase n=1 Tax=Rhizobacter sp. Root1221 TaxID=1736433 RepID=UPI0009E84521
MRMPPSLPSPPGSPDSQVRARTGEETAGPSGPRAVRRRLNPPDGPLGGLPTSSPPDMRQQAAKAAPEAGASSARPRANLPAPQPAAARPVIDWGLAVRHYPELTDYLDDLEAAHESDTVAGAELIQDMIHLGDLIEGLNSADPSLKLKSYALEVPDKPSALLDSPLVEDLRVGLGTGDAWRAVVDSGNHRVAMSIQCSKGSNDASILVVDASAAESEDSKRFMSKKWLDIMSAVAQCVGETLKSPAGPPRLHTTFTCSGAQKSPLGCAIFSLSATKKMASDPHITSRPHARRSGNPGHHTWPCVGRGQRPPAAIVVQARDVREDHQGVRRGPAPRPPNGPEPHGQRPSMATRFRWSGRAGQQRRRDLVETLRIERGGSIRSPE